MTRNSCFTVATLALMGLSIGQAHAQTTLASWTFNNQTLVADGGKGSGVTTITAAGLTNTTPNNIAGVAYAASGPSGLATDFYLRAGIGGGGTSATSNEGGLIQWAASTVGYTGTTITFAADNSSATSGAFTTETLYYTTNGTQFITAPSLVYSLGQSFTTYTANLSAISSGAIDNNPNAAYRIVFTGSSNYSGTGGPNARVDNLSVTGIAVTPEPSSVAGMVMGMSVLGLLVARRKAVKA